MRIRTSWRGVALTTWVVTWLIGAHAAAAQPAPTDRVVVRLGVGSRAASRTFASTTGFTLFSEPGTLRAEYEIEPGSIVDGGLAFRFWRNLAIGLDVSSYKSSRNTAQLSADLPHPFVFDLPRRTTGAARDLERQELAVHIRALWMIRLADWLVVSVSGGPSLLHARQHLVASIEYTELAFPFVEVLFAGHTVDTRSKNTLGLNGGVDIDTFVLHKLPILNRYGVVRHIGLGLLIQYVRGSVDLQLGDDPIDVDLGGLQLTGGLRLRF